MTDAPPDVSRRDFLRVSMASAALLSVAGPAAVLSGCSSPAQPAAGMVFLTASDQAIFKALLPAVVSTGLAADGPERLAAEQNLLRALDATLQRLHAGGQKQMRQLLDLLAGGLTRRIATGLKRDWPELSVAEIQEFLSRWHGSSLQLFNAGYAGLVKLTAAAHYSQASNARATGYPGPLAWAYAVANAP